MRDHVREQWINFNRNLEGIKTWLYADVKGFVTTGMGNLVDPLSTAIVLPWKLPANIPASATAIRNAWLAVKHDPATPRRKAEYYAQLAANNIRLDLEDVEKLIITKLEANDRFMVSRFPDWDTFPADAQMAAHSMAWAMGPAFFRKFPKFTGAFSAGEYARACRKVGPAPWGGDLYECDIKPDLDAKGKPMGTIPERNRRNRALLENAASGGEPLDWSSEAPTGA